MVTTWSISRDQVLHSCERRYYFQYVAGARIDSLDPTKMEIAFLRKVTNVPMWRGNLLHRLVSDYLNGVTNGSKGTLNDILKTHLEKISASWSLSQTFAAKDIRDRIDFVKKGGIILLEHIENREMNGTDLANLTTLISNCATRFEEWFLKSGLHDRIANAERIWIEPTTYGKEAPGFALDDFRVITKVDLAMQERNGKFVIFDWKTGKEPVKVSGYISQPEFQASVYQLWPHDAFKKKLNDISAVFVYIGGEGVRERRFSVDESQKHYTTNLIQRSASRMRFLDDVEPTGKQQKLDGMSYLTLSDLEYAIANFYCRNCGFKSMCIRRVLQ